MKITTKNIIYLIGILFVYFVLMQYFERTIFNVRPGRIKEDVDGFENSLVYFNESNESMPIWLTIRWLLVYPFIAMDGFSLSPILQSLYLLVYSLYLSCWFPRGSKINYFQFIIIFLPVFVSFRMALTIFSIIYMYVMIADNKYNPILSLLYLPIIFLSTSSMYIYICIYLLHIVANLKHISLSMKIITTLIFFVVVDQFYQKLNDLFQRFSGGELLSSAERLNINFEFDAFGFILSLFTGNPFYVTLINGRVLEFVFLMFSILLSIYLLSTLYKKKMKSEIKIILIIGSSLVAEGLGAYALGIVVFIIYSHRNRLSKLRQ